MNDQGYIGTDVDYWIAKTIYDIKKDYGHDVSVAQKHKNLLKFGRNEEVQTSKTTVMTLPSGVQNETYVSDNLITTISSSNNSDTEVIRVEGHTVDANGDFTFTVQNITLTGQTQASLTTPLARCTRLANEGSTELLGTVYAYQDDTSTAGVPDTATLVHCMIPAGYQQSFKASTTISSQDYWLINNLGCSVLEKTASNADFTLEVRLKGGVFRPIITITASNGTTMDHEFIPPLVVPANSDIRVIAVASGANTDCAAHIQGTLAIKV